MDPKLTIEFISKHFKNIDQSFPPRNRPKSLKTLLNHTLKEISDASDPHKNYFHPIKHNPNHTILQFSIYAETDSLRAIYASPKMCLWEGRMMKRRKLIYADGLPYYPAQAEIFRNHYLFFSLHFEALSDECDGFILYHDDSQIIGFNSSEWIQKKKTGCLYIFN